MFHHAPTLAVGHYLDRSTSPADSENLIALQYRVYLLVVGIHYIVIQVVGVFATLYTCWIPLQSSLTWNLRQVLLILDWGTASVGEVVMRFHL